MHFRFYTVRIVFRNSITSEKYKHKCCELEIVSVRADERGGQFFKNVPRNAFVIEIHSLSLHLWPKWLPLLSFEKILCVFSSLSSKWLSLNVISLCLLKPSCSAVIRRGGFVFCASLVCLFCGGFPWQSRLKVSAPNFDSEERIKTKFGNGSGQVFLITLMVEAKFKCGRSPADNTGHNL